MSNPAAAPLKETTLPSRQPMRQEYALDTTPPALSHYTDAVRWGDLLLVSGCVALDSTGEVVAPGDAKEQARVVHEHLASIFSAAGTDFAHVLKVTVFLTDIADRQAVNDIRTEYFGDSRPASTLVEVGALVVPGLVVEIEATVGIPGRGEGASPDAQED